jgi:hypothetical protein
MKCKSILHWDFTSPQSKWLSSRKQTRMNAGEDGDKGTLLFCECECKLANPLLKSLLRFIKN